MKLCYEGKKRLKWLALICAVLAVLGIVRHFFGDGGYTDAFGESDGVFAVTVNLRAEYTASDKKLLFASLEGCGIKTSFFCSADYIEQNKDEINELIKKGNFVYLYLAIDESQTKQQIMKHIAVENDRFFALAGKYPVFVRTDEKPSSKTLDILTAYGQLCCFDTAKLSGKKWGSGNVLELDAADTASVCRLVEEISKRTENGYTCVGLSDIVKTANNITNSIKTSQKT